MEFPFNINHLLGKTINKLDCSVSPARKNADGYDYHGLRQLLMQVIDRMGNASAKAQGLRTVITTGRKLELSDHILYMMRDDELNNGTGAAVGLLKIGRKRLFVYDSRGRVHEMNPVCVLDFYVHESRQRMGCGKLLFDYMLKDQNIKPVHLAIDKPSFKFSQFLKKHYNLIVELPQVNNFVVYEGFFNSRTDLQNGRNGIGRPPSYPGLHEGDVIMRKQGSAYSNVRKHNSSRPSSGAHTSHHSSPRRRDTSENSELQNLNLAVRNVQNDDILEKLMGRERERDAHPEIRYTPNPNTRQYGASITNYSRHGSTPPPGSRPDSSVKLGRRHSGRGLDRNQSADDTPPLLARDGPSYQEKMNMHQEYQGRNGHLKLGSTTSLPSIDQKQNVLQINDKNVTQDFLSGIPTPWRGTPGGYNWTVSGGPTNHQTIGARHYTHTRLW